MSESKYRALLIRYRNEVPIGHQPHMAAHLVDELLAEPPVQSEPFWYAVVSDKAPVINKAIKRKDVATEYASQCSHEDVMIIPLYLHPPAAQVAEPTEAVEIRARNGRAFDDLVEEMKRDYPNEMALAGEWASGWIDGLKQGMAAKDGDVVKVPRELLERVKKHLGDWLDERCCECEYGHSCGRTEVSLAASELRALLGGAG